MKLKIRNGLLTIMITTAMVFTMMPMMAQPTYAIASTIELDGGSYTLTADNRLVKDGNPEDVHDIHSIQDVVFNGNTVINLNGYELRCASLKSDSTIPVPTSTHGTPTILPSMEEIRAAASISEIQPMKTTY